MLVNLNNILALNEFEKFCMAHNVFNCNEANGVPKRALPAVEAWVLARRTSWTFSYWHHVPSCSGIVYTLESPWGTLEIFLGYSRKHFGGYRGEFSVKINKE